MARFEYTLSEADYNRAYVLVDDTFDVHVVRTEEGLVVDVYQRDGNDCLATLAVLEDDLNTDT